MKRMTRGILRRCPPVNNHFQRIPRYCNHSSQLSLTSSRIEREQCTRNVIHLQTGKSGRQRSSFRHAGPLFIHDKAFTAFLHCDSTRELVEWVANAAMLLDCPAGLSFLAVGATIPQIWIDANLAMDSLSRGESGKRYVTWHEAVQTFEDFLGETRGTRIQDHEDILLRVMRHREAEGSDILMEEARRSTSGGNRPACFTWILRG